MSLSFVLTCSTFFCAAALIGGGRPEQKPVTIVESWFGVVQDMAARQNAPAGKIIMDEKCWAKLWKAWKGEEKLPQVDFSKYIILVETVGGPNRLFGKPLIDKEGNVTLGVAATLKAGTGFSYLMFQIPQEGIKTINGKTLAQAAAQLPFDVYDGYFVKSGQAENADTEPALFALVDQNQFDAVFGVAAVMHDKSHRLPNDLFDKHLVLGMVQRGNAVVQYKVQSVAVKDDTVEIRYKATVSESGSATFASPMILSLEKGPYKRAVFIEGDKKPLSIDLPAMK